MLLTQSLIDPLRGKSKLVSERYGVSPKTVRDIWNFRTWSHVTLGERTQIVSRQTTIRLLNDSVNSSPVNSEDWLEGDLKGALSIVSAIKPRIGRPPGSKDKVPRRRRKETSLSQPSLPSILKPVPDSGSSEQYATATSTPSDLHMANTEAPLDRTYPFFLSFDNDVALGNLKPRHASAAATI